jgi:hypothetical protein
LTGPATAKLSEIYTHAKQAFKQWRFLYLPVRYHQASSVDLAIRVHVSAKHKGTELSFKKPISRTTPVCDFLQELCDQVAKALPVPPFSHLLFLLLSMPVIWLVCRAISSGK